MKYLAALAATLVLPVLPDAAAQGYACAGGELSGGPHGAAYCSGSTSSTSGSTKIIKVERQAYGHPPSPGASSYASSGYVDSYTHSQVYDTPRRHPGYHGNQGAATSHFTHPPVSYEDDAATSYGFEWWTSERYYGRTGHLGYTHGYHQSAPREVTTSTYGAARPCSYYAAPAVTTTYTGCAGATTTYTAPARTTTTYTTTTPTYVEPAPVYEYQPEPEPDYGYDDYAYAPVVALNSGVCDREITRIRDDRQGRQRYEVCYRDLTPIYGGRVEVLYSRIERAAERACDTDSFYMRNRSSRKCEYQAIDRAVYDTGLEALASYHVAKTGRGRPRVTVGPLQRY